MVSLKNKTILVVDDEPGYREVLTEEFEMVGATVISANNGFEAYDIFQKQKIDAIISDIRMPGGDGVTFLAKVRSVNFQLPVVMLISGFADLSLEDAYDMGADAVFSKPCNLEHMVESVFRALLPEKERWAQPSQESANMFKLEIKADTMDDFIHAKMVNIGRGGIFFVYSGPLIKKNTKFVFRLTFGNSGNEVFCGNGISRWVRAAADGDLSPGVGMEFLDLTESSLKILSQIIKKFNPKAFIPKNVLK